MIRAVLLVFLCAGCRAVPPATADAGVPGDAGVACPSTKGPARRLNRAEYDATVLALLGDSSAPARKFPPDEEPLGFDTDTSAQSVSPLLAERYFDAAEKLAATASLPACDATDGCAVTFLNQTRLFRRPLTGDEKTRLLALFNKVKAQETADASLRTVVSAMLQSPQFLYRDADQGPVLLASRLSYFLLGAPPDQTLLAAPLTTKAEVAAQARRLLAEPRARDQVKRFHLQWLGVAHVDSLQKDSARFPGFAEVAPVLSEETARLAEWVVFDGAGNFSRLFNGRVTFVNPALAKLQALPPVDEGFHQVSTDLTARVGVLTQPAVLSVWAKADQTSPVQRGKLIRERVLCDPPPPPPGNVIIKLGAPSSGTARQRFEAHVSDPACSTCHQRLDPLGFGLEKFDAIGQYRAQENGLAVDDSGEFRFAGSLDGPFAGATELSEKLAASDEVKRCYVKQWFRYGFGRREVSDDACAIDQLTDAFRASGWNVRELLIAFTQSSTFLDGTGVTR